MFDEPSSYLDVKQRLSAARTIRELLRPDDYVIVVEHDLSVLDYLSDFICVLYGRPAAYGVVTLPASVREGINIFLDGNIPTENLRFREESLTFRIAEAGEEFMVDRARGFTYPTMVSNFPFPSRALTYREGKNIGGFPLDHRRWRVHRL
jgi:ATP-binding cassette subfamily E protein 1